MQGQVDLKGFFFSFSFQKAVALQDFLPFVKFNCLKNAVFINKLSKLDKA